ncbi:MAG: hypothetical protein COX41_06370 [Candidatus Omnitrophica bacterium CG23_combo_of_CG06-09_8_20_14_all_41_10]|uniref:ParB-like N-terminal domain-containing protein n=1 Tax=Candidatus Sherwoodlollariibacterium unditelluris TaxID=1974757 RepID=A0A2G9YHR4_9BACT|nr:MAG: hypothetical protein COX41_06370 [Candidatus Omnitrophica bacterium CG23_combo_of_CG06-09_8_20_14_all_41_10]
MEYRKLSTLRKLANNPRIIRDKQFQNLVASIKDNPKYFEARPLILSNRTGEFVIIAGNQRYEATKVAGLKEAPTCLIEGLTEEKEKEITIRDNTQQGEWDFDALANGWDDLPLVDWGIKELESLLGDEREKLEQKEKELKPYKKIHVLVSVDIDSADEVMNLLDKLRKIQGVEIEQSAN